MTYIIRQIDIPKFSWSCGLMDEKLKQLRTCTSTFFFLSLLKKENICWSNVWFNIMGGFDS